MGPRTPGVFQWLELGIRVGKALAPVAKWAGAKLGLLEPDGVPLPHRNVELREEQIRQATSHKVAPSPGAPKKP
jgi:hypothetical protein